MNLNIGFYEYLFKNKNAKPFIFVCNQCVKFEKNIFEKCLAQLFEHFVHLLWFNDLKISNVHIHMRLCRWKYMLV